MAKRKNQIVIKYARMWPREIFDMKKDNKLLVRNIEELKALKNPGVYVLYRDEQPRYIGKSKCSLLGRLHDHANKSTDRYFSLWNHFSAFIVDEKQVDDVESILIAAMPTTANSSSPKITQISLPNELRRRLRKARQSRFVSEGNGIS